MSRPTAQDYALVNAHLDPNRSLAAHTAWDVRDCGAKAVMALRASLAAAEAKLADEVRHADDLAKALDAACGHDANDYNCDEWPPGTPCRGCAGDKARKLALTAHAARRKEDSNG